MYKVYLIQSYKDESYYIGQTNNINDRLQRHNSGKVHSTKNKLPWKLIGYESYNSRSEAMWREHMIKTRKREKEKFIDFLINNSGD